MVDRGLASLTSRGRKRRISRTPDVGPGFMQPRRVCQIGREEIVETVVIVLASPIGESYGRLTMAQTDLT